MVAMYDDIVRDTGVTYVEVLLEKVKRFYSCVKSIASLFPFSQGRIHTDADVRLCIILDIVMMAHYS